MDVSWLSGRRWSQPEAFVRRVVAGGLVMIVGLWTIEFTVVRSIPWWIGVALTLVGVGGLALGIRQGLRR